MLTIKHYSILHNAIIHLFHVGRDKKKDFAPNSAAFYPLGADLFLSARKVDHIARFIQIPAINVHGDVPSILIINIQVAACFFFRISHPFH